MALPRPIHWLLTIVLNRPARWFPAVSAAALLCGCHSHLAPSEQLRRASHAQFEERFTGDRDAVRRQTYLIFSGGPEFRANLDPETGNFHWSGDGEGFSSGLAVSVAADGYLATTAHALNAVTFVFGRIDGRTDARPARVVFTRRTKTHTDLAILKVDGNLEQPGAPGDKPAIGDGVFSVVCNRNGTQLEMAFAGGTVTGVTRDPLDGPIDLIETDLPLRRGDSGGPLLSSTGRLVGINSGVRFNWRKRWSDSLYPDHEFIQQRITEDRARAPTLSSQPDISNPRPSRRLPTPQ